MKRSELIFVLDPMCSWCWGMAPVVDGVRDQFGERFDIHLVMGGLRTKGEMVWNDDSKAYLKTHWQQVAARTGQPFNEILFEKEQFEYDTYPACKAVVTVRELQGEEEAFRYLHTIQHAFYAQGIDITNSRLLFGYYEQLFGNSGKFAFMYGTEHIETLTAHDFAKARSMGANAFPSIVIVDEAGHMVCQKGYRSLEEMNTLLEAYDA
ncbi:MAG: DsbA family protein [Sulfurovum sp.]|nr:DsbA family protein [Sulfurovum sp.]